MLSIGNTLLFKDAKPLLEIKEFYIKWSLNNLHAFAETTDIGDKRGFYLVEKIEVVSGDHYIHLKELDPMKNVSASEKIVDIREFYDK